MSDADRVVVRAHVPVVSEEHFDLLDEKGLLLGQHKLRAEVHRDGDWHRSVHIWVVHSLTNGVLIQLRSHSKDSFPDCWDVSCAGHVTAGETSETAAVSELEEELGMTVTGIIRDPVEWLRLHIDKRSKQLLYIDTVKREVISQQGRFIDREFVDVYLLYGVFPLDSLRLQPDEVSAAQYINLQEYIYKLQTQAQGFVPFPDLIEYTETVFNRIQQIVSSY